MSLTTLSVQLHVYATKVCAHPNTVVKIKIKRFFVLAWHGLILMSRRPRSILDYFDVQLIRNIPVNEMPSFAQTLNESVTPQV